MSNTRQRIFDDIKTAMKAGDKPRLGTLRLLAAAIKQIEVDKRIELDEAATIVLLDKQLKQRRESISQFEKAGRDDLVAQEQVEAELIKTYLPAALDAAEIEAIVSEAISATSATSVKDMGQVMAKIKPQLQGRADMGAVSQQIRQRLSA
ncbi:MAG: GatB/YqeY domain-containing protein [Granulosicoccus sp.]